MKKSDEKSNFSQEEKLSKLPKVDYSKVPKRILDMIGDKPYTLEKKVKLTKSRGQFLIRIPSEIAREMNITLDNRVIFRFKKPAPTSNERPALDMELI